QVLFHITRQLHKMSRILVQPTVDTGSLRVSSDAIRMLHKQFNGKNIIIAVNESSHPVTATFHAGFSASNLHVWFESRQISGQNGSWSDHFKPYDVHIYAQAANLPAPLVKKAKSPKGVNMPIHYSP